MKKLRHVLLSLVVLILFHGLFLLPKSVAGVHVNIGINLPILTFPAPPPMVVVPGTYAYYAPDAEMDIFFYHGFWYRPYEGRWFTARAYNGPWAYIEPARVPSVIVDLPPDYRHHVRPGHERIPYGQFKKNWRRWEREKYWDRHAGGYGQERGHGNSRVVKNRRGDDHSGHGRDHGRGDHHGD